MPQITLEYTSNINDVEDFKPVVINIHKIIESQCNVNINNCKTRINCIENFVIGTGNPTRKFMHLEVKLFEGRSDDIISSLGELLINDLSNYESIAQKNFDLALTVHILGIDRAKYFKYVHKTQKKE